MARALLTATVMDQAGNVVQNALVNVYLTGTTTPVSDMFAAASGGSPVTQLTSDGRGMIVGWFTADKVVDLVVTDNTHAAYRPDTPATLLTFVDYTKTVAVEPDQSMVVHTTGAETIAGVKTFSSSPVVPDGSFSAAKLSFDVATQAELDAESSTRASGDTAAIATAEAFAVQRSNHTGTQTASTVSDFNTAVRTNRLDQMAAPTAALALNSQKITGLANPTAAQDAMTKASADAAYAPASGIAESAVTNLVGDLGRLAPRLAIGADGGYTLTHASFGTLGPYYPNPATTGCTIEHVDTVLGSDSNQGIAAGASAKKTLASALSRGLSFGLPLIVYITAPVTAPLRELAQINTALNVWLIAETPGTPWYWYSSSKFTSGWTNVAGAVYSRTLAANPRLVAVTDVLDTNGYPTKLAEVVASGAIYPQVNGTASSPGAGQYGYTGGTLYVNLTDGSDPNTHTLEVPTLAASLQSIGTGTTTIVDAVARYGTIANIEAGGQGTNAAKVVAIRCIGEFSGTNGNFNLSTTGTLMVCIHCQAHRANNDGFAPTTNTGVASTFVEWVCEAGFNDDQGSSSHQNATVVRVGSRYHHCYDGGIVDVQSTSSYNYDCEVDHNTTDSAERGRAAGVDIFDTTTVLAAFERMDVHDNTGPGITITKGCVSTLGPYRSGVGAGNTAVDNLAL